MDIYMILIEAGITDPIFSLTRIRRLPLRSIREATTKATLAIKSRRNSDSLAIAQLGVLMYQIGMAFSSSKDAPNEISVKSFLPHPEILEDTKRTQLSAKAQKVLQYLIANDTIRNKLINVVGKYGIFKDA